MTIRGRLAAAIPYLATFAWAFAAYAAAQIAALAALLLYRHGDLGAILAAPYDGAVVTLSVLVLNPVSTAVLLLAARLRAAKPLEYLGLIWPRPRAATIGAIGILVIIAATDGLLLASGRAIVSPFQEVSYTTAAAEGWLPLMWFATVIVAPAGEEIMFRGYLFRGWVHSRPAAWIAVPLISLLWAGLHIQYDWTGMAEILAAGLFLGWMRWLSGSTLLTFLLHALFNLEGMFETLVQVKHLL
jgi:CAAX protease family protein